MFNAVLFNGDVNRALAAHPLMRFPSALGVSGPTDIGFPVESVFDCVDVIRHRIRILKRIAKRLQGPVLVFRLSFA